LSNVMSRIAASNDSCLNFSKVFSCNRWI
jgi:hypothetical protein